MNWYKIIKSQAGIRGYWIDPNGQLHSVAGGDWHDDIIKKIAPKEKSNEKAMENGWIRIVIYDDPMGVCYGLELTYKPTSTQMQALRSIVPKDSEVWIDISKDGDTDTEITNVRGMARILQSLPDKPVNKTQEKTAQYTKIYGYWIAPDGTLHMVPKDKHHNNILDEIMLRNLSSKQWSTDMAISQGWIRALCSYAYPGAIYGLELTYKPTPAQMKTIRGLLHEDLEINVDIGEIDKKYYVKTSLDADLRSLPKILLSLPEKFQDNTIMTAVKETIRKVKQSRYEKNPIDKNEAEQMYLRNCSNSDGDPTFGLRLIRQWFIKNPIVDKAQLQPNKKRTNPI